MPASRGGKLKTLLQGLAVGAALMPPLATAHLWVGNTLLWASVVVAVISGLQYLLGGRDGGHRPWHDGRPGGPAAPACRPAVRPDAEPPTDRRVR